MLHRLCSVAAAHACRAQAVALLLGLAGCGGGVWIGDGDFGDDPEVSLTASATTVAPGQVVRLAAAASDDFGVRQVNFYSVQSGDDVLLGSDTSVPYGLDVQVAANASGTLQFVARASDFDGNSSRSGVVSVNVVP